MSEYSTKPLVRVKSLSKRYMLSKSLTKKQFFFAVNNCSFEIARKEILGIVGESGSGKSTLGKAILRLIEPDFGEVWFENYNILNLKKRELRKERRHFQMIFQDPYSSLNPQMTIKEILSEPFLVHERLSSQEILEKVEACIQKVGLGIQALSRYPHQFSGGQRQRIGIARAIALNPSLIIADEPVSALDVSIQAQIINLLLDLQDEYHLAYLFISHNLHLVQRIADRTAVMYFGKIVEIGSSFELYRKPLHPYTETLLSSAHLYNKDKKDDTVSEALYIETNQITDEQKRGCVFRFRCQRYKTLSFEKKKYCDTIEPSLAGDSNHLVACHAVVENSP